MEEDGWSAITQEEAIRYRELGYRVILPALKTYYSDDQGLVHTAILSAMDGFEAIGWTVSENEDSGTLSFNWSYEFQDNSYPDDDLTFLIHVEDLDGHTATQEVITKKGPPIMGPTGEAGSSTSTITIDENSTAVYSFTSDGNPTTWDLNGGPDASSFTINRFGDLSFHSAPNFESPSDANGDNDYSVVIRASNGITTSEQTVTVSVANVLESGEFGTGDIATEINENTTDVFTFSANNSVSWSISGGADQALFNLSTDSGQSTTLSFQSAPDHESASDDDTDNDYVVVVTSSDGSNSFDQTVTVTVADVDDTPPIVTGPSGNAGDDSGVKAITENLTAVHTFTATDDSSVTWSLNGGADASLFTINSSSGALAFLTAPDFEIPTDTDNDNIYIVKVRAIDSSGNLADQTVTVGIVNVAEETNNAQQEAPNDVAHGSTSNESNNSELKQLETPNSDWGNAIKVDEDGNIFIAGATYGKMIDQTYDLSTHTVTDNVIENDDPSGNTTDAYISRMTLGPGGMISGTKLIGTSFDNEKFNNDEITAFDTNEEGDIFAALRSEWNPSTYQTLSESKIVKILSDGNGETFYSIGENQDEFNNNLDAYDIKVAKDGAIYVAGHTNYDLYGQEVTSNYNYNSSDAFISKFDERDGSHLWTRLLGGIQTEGAYTLELDEEHNHVYVGGVTTSNFDEQNLNGYYKDGFIAKFNKDGEKIWTKFIGTEGVDEIKDIVVSKESSYDMQTDNDVEDCIYVVGVTDTSFNAEQQIIGGDDIFVMKLDSDGDNKWDNPVIVGTVDNDKVTSAGIIQGDLGIATNSIDKKSYSTGYFYQIRSDGTLSGTENFNDIEPNKSTKINDFYFDGNKNLYLTGSVEEPLNEKKTGYYIEWINYSDMERTYPVTPWTGSEEHAQSALEYEESQIDEKNPDVMGKVRFGEYEASQTDTYVYLTEVNNEEQNDDGHHDGSNGHGDEYSEGSYPGDPSDISEDDDNSLIDESNTQEQQELTEPYQTVSASSEEISFSPGKDINFDLVYTTSDSQNALTGLELKVHYDSSVFTPSGENNGVSALVDTFGEPSIIDDTDDLDNDATTDKYLNIIWADFTPNPNFPGTELPTTLATLNLSSSKEGVDSLTGESKESKINFTSSDPAMNYDFLSQSVVLKPQSFNLDVDGDGKVAALGDGLMVIRKLFGAAFAGDVLTNKAISNTATRTTQEIHNFIQAGIDEKVLDVDGDGSVTALGDGLMVIRKLFGAAFAGDALTDKALSNNATRTTDEIHEYIAAMNDVGSSV